MVCALEGCAARRRAWLDHIAGSVAMGHCALGAGLVMSRGPLWICVAPLLDCLWVRLLAQPWLLGWFWVTCAVVDIGKCPGAGCRARSKALLGH